MLMRHGRQSLAKQQPSHRSGAPPHPLASSLRGTRHRLQVTAGAGPSVEVLRHVLPDGCGLELLVQRASSGSPSARPPLLFVHGSYHGAWCWAEYFLPYFAHRGYDAYAVSMRSQGGSDVLAGAAAGTLDSHVADLSHLLAAAPCFQGGGGAPVVVSHSFGGLIMQKYIVGMQASEGQPGHPRLGGTAFLNSVPPSGNSQMVSRFLRRDLLLSFKVTWGFITRSFARSPAACRELFFSPDLPEADLARYQRQLAQASSVRLIDLGDLKRQVPLAPRPLHSPPAFVLGGVGDCVVDVPAVEELALWAGTAPVVLPGVAHDSMLDTRWEQVASQLEAWTASLSTPAG